LVEAEVRIRFGPVVNDEAKRLMFKEGVQDVKVWYVAQPGRERPNEGITNLPERMRIPGGDAGNSFDFHWSGHFLPEYPGTLVIEARDLDEHFAGRDGPSRGDRLDSDPSSPAHAQAKPPYSWNGYEPGPDRNHRLTIKRSDCDAAYTRDANEAMQSGTWSGSSHLKYRHKIDSGAIVEESTTIAASFQSLLVNPRVQLIQVGQGHGKFEARWWDGEKKSMHVHTGHVRATGSAAYHDPGAQEHRGEISFLYRSETCNLQTDTCRKSFRRDGYYGVIPDRLEVAAVGLRCWGEAFEGSRTDANGLRTTTWSFKYAPGSAPEHVRLLAGSRYSQDVRFGRTFNLEGWARQQFAVLRPIFERLAALKEGNKARDIRSRMDAAHKASVEIIDAKLWGPGSLDERIRRAYSEAQDLWRDDGEKPANPDDYLRQIAILKAELSDWQHSMAAVEATLIAAAEQAASQIEEYDAARAATLRRTVGTLRAAGLTAIGATIRSESRG
jgi:hypothetical protein